MPTVTINKQTKDMFGNNCEPCNDVNHVDNLGSTYVNPGDSLYIQTRPSRGYYDESLPEGFRTKRITVLNKRTNETTIYDESGLGGNPTGGINGVMLDNIIDDLEITADFGAGPAQGYGATGSGVTGNGSGPDGSTPSGSSGGGDIIFSPDIETGQDDYLQGQRLTIYPVPDEGYELVEVWVNDEYYGDANEIVIDPLIENVNVTAVFQKTTYTENIVRIKRGNTAGLSGVTLLDGEFGFNNETKELRIGDDPDAAKSFINCYLINSGGGTGGGSGSMNPILPVTRNCLTAWSDTSGGYLKDADADAFVPNGLFVKHPMNMRQGDYKIKTYGNLTTTCYAGIVDLTSYCNCNHLDHPNTGFVVNMIRNVNGNQIGGGLLVRGHDGYMALAIKPANGNPIESLIIYQNGAIQSKSISADSMNIKSGTYNVNGSPHTHSQYLDTSGGTMAGNINANNHTIKNLANPVDPGDAVNFGFISGLASGIIWVEPVEDIVTEPPETPSNGDRYLVAHDGVSGDFASHADEIAVWNGSWYYYEPEAGWALLNKNSGFNYSFNGTIWIQMSSSITHASLIGLAGDDHSQYVHMTQARTITARHTFDDSVPFLVTSNSLVPNLNANYLDGATKASFAAANHSHDWVALSGFKVVNVQDGQILEWDEDEQAFVNVNNPYGSFVIDPAHQFADATERDTYFSSHPEELLQGTLIAIGSGFEMYDTGVWVDKTAIIRGPAGLNGANGRDGIDGAAGPQGPQGSIGPQGPEGPPGSPGTSITMKGSVSYIVDLPSSGNTEDDGYYCEEDGDCYVWTGTEWVNVGPIVGPRGLQGPQGPMGPQGIQGVVGPTGSVGPQGPAGPAGEQGPQGIPGEGSESWQDPVEDIVNDPPGIVDEGDRFIVGTSPTGAFAGHANKIAIYQDSTWLFDAPITGWVTIVMDDNVPYSFNGSTWVQLQTAAASVWGGISGTLSDQTDLNTALGNKVSTSSVGAASGVCPLGADSKVAAIYLPSYVDDVLEYAGIVNFPVTGESNKIYVDTATNKTYRWSGSDYVEVGGGGVALGETESTAYRGDRGKTAYDHSQVAHAPSDAEKNVQSDWNQSNTEADDYIKNKPTIPGEYSLPTASDIVLGGIKVGSRLTITDGVLSADEQGGSYTLPTASADTLGGVKIGSGITITDGVISAASGGGGITWNEVTGTAQAAAADNGYICNNAALVTVTLPSTCAVGKTIRIAGKGTGLWKIAQNAGQQIIFGNKNSTSGTPGYIAALYQYDSVELLCITADTVFSVTYAVGDLDVV